MFGELTKIGMINKSRFLLILTFFALIEGAFVFLEKVPGRYLDIDILIADTVVCLIVLPVTWTVTCLIISIPFRELSYFKSYCSTIREHFFKKKKH